MKTTALLPAGSVLLLLLSGLTWFWQPAGGGLPWAMQSIPLLLTLPGLCRGDRRARQWFGFILLFIVFVSIGQSFNPLPILRMLAITILLAAIALFGWLLYSMKSVSPVPSAQKES